MSVVTPNKHKAEMRMITPIPRKYLHNSGIKIESEKTCIFLILHGSYKQAKTIYSQILRKKPILIRHYVCYHMHRIISTTVIFVRYYLGKSINR